MDASQRLRKIKKLAKDLAEEIEAFEQEIEPDRAHNTKLDIPSDLGSQLKDLCGGFKS
jgi:hypothetical protein